MSARELLLGCCLPPLVCSDITSVLVTCRDYVPNDSGLNRLAYTAQFFANNGFYVLLDNQ